jgi:hypothetical protein
LYHLPLTVAKFGKSAYNGGMQSLSVILSWGLENIGHETFLLHISEECRFPENSHRDWHFSIYCLQAIYRRCLKTLGMRPCTTAIVSRILIFPKKVPKGLATIEKEIFASCTSLQKRLTPPKEKSDWR